MSVSFLKKLLISLTFHHPEYFPLQAFLHKGFTAFRASDLHPPKLPWNPQFLPAFFAFEVPMLSFRPVFSEPIGEV